MKQKDDYKIPERIPMRAELTTDTALGDHKAELDHVTKAIITTPLGNLEIHGWGDTLYIGMETGGERFTIQAQGDGLIEVMLYSLTGGHATIMPAASNVYRIGAALTMAEAGQAIERARAAAQPAGTP